MSLVTSGIDILLKRTRDKIGQWIDGLEGNQTDLEGMINCYYEQLQELPRGVAFPFLLMRKSFSILIDFTIGIARIYYFNFWYTVCLSEINIKLASSPAILEQQSQMNLITEITKKGGAWVVFNQSGHVIEWSDSSIKLFGYAREEATGKLATETFIPSGLGSFLTQLCCDPNSFKLNCNKNCSKDGKFFTMFWVNFSLPDNHVFSVGFKTLFPWLTKLFSLMWRIYCKVIKIGDKLIRR
jgi:PAS domain S-box-containing protein